MRLARILTGTKRITSPEGIPSAGERIAPTKPSTARAWYLPTVMNVTKSTAFALSLFYLLFVPVTTNRLGPLMFHLPPYVASLPELGARGMTEPHSIW